MERVGEMSWGFACLAQDINNVIVELKTNKSNLFRHAELINNKSTRKNMGKPILLCLSPELM